MKLLVRYPVYPFYVCYMPYFWEERYWSLRQLSMIFKDLFGIDWAVFKGNSFCSNVILWTLLLERLTLYLEASHMMVHELSYWFPSPAFDDFRGVWKQNVVEVYNVDVFIMISWPSDVERGEINKFFLNPWFSCFNQRDFWSIELNSFVLLWFRDPNRLCSNRLCSNGLCSNRLCSICSSSCSRNYWFLLFDFGYCSDFRCLILLGYDVILTLLCSPTSHVEY